MDLYTFGILFVDFWGFFVQSATFSAYPSHPSERPPCRSAYAAGIGKIPALAGRGLTDVGHRREAAENALITTRVNQNMLIGLTQHNQQNTHRNDMSS